MMCARRLVLVINFNRAIGAPGWVREVPKMGGFRKWGWDEHGNEMGRMKKEKQGQANSRDWLHLTN